MNVRVCQDRSQDSSMEGFGRAAEGGEPSRSKAPRGWGLGRGVPSPSLENFANYKLKIFKSMVVNPRTTKLFLSTFAPNGGLHQPPWILVFPTEFFGEIFHGYSFGVKESNVDS